MTTIRTSQNNIVVFYDLAFDNGLRVIITASPLSPETGREILGNYTEEYTMIGLQQPAKRSYPFLRGIPMGADYIAAQLDIEEPIKSLVAKLMPRLTILDLPDLILLDAEIWYSNYYQVNQQLPLV